MKEKDELLEAGGSTTKGTAGFALSVFNLMNAILGKKKKHFLSEMNFRHSQALAFSVFPMRWRKWASFPSS